MKHVRIWLKVHLIEFIVTMVLLVTNGVQMCLSNEELNTKTARERKLILSVIGDSSYIFKSWYFTIASAYNNPPARTDLRFLGILHMFESFPVHRYYDYELMRSRRNNMMAKLESVIVPRPEVSRPENEARAEADGIKLMELLEIGQEQCSSKTDVQRY